MASAVRRFVYRSRATARMQGQTRLDAPAGPGERSRDDVERDERRHRAEHQAHPLAEDPVGIAQGQPGGVRYGHGRDRHGQREQDRSSPRTPAQPGAEESRPSGRVTLRAAACGVADAPSLVASEIHG